MKRVLLLVEGQTEDTFVDRVLRPYFLVRDIHLASTLICTKRVHHQRVHRGGTGSRYRHIRRGLEALLGDSDAAAVSTLIDYIDEGSDTSPAARLASLFGGYEKVFHGSLIAETIGLQTIRAKCPKFAAWVDRLEAAVRGR